MFDFLSSDWFIIGIEIVFLILIIYDIRQYILTKKKEYITNIVLTFAFFVWASIPFYNKYITWNEDKMKTLHIECLAENNETVCNCLEDSVVKEYSLADYEVVKSKEEYKEFIKETKEDCLDDSWF